MRGEAKGVPMRARSQANGAAVARLGPDASLASLVPLHTRLTRRFVAQLGAQGLKTVGDVALAGGLPNAAAGNARDTAAVGILSAHAALSAFSADTTVNALLIERGFTSASIIAATPAAAFAAAVAAGIGTREAEELHGAAVALHRSILNHAVAGWTAESGPGVSAPRVPAAGQCEDWQSATSPLAYLADLLDYTVRHVLLSGTAVDVPVLSPCSASGSGRYPPPAIR